MKTKQTIIKSPSIRILTAIVEGLEEIGAHFEMIGFGAASSMSSSEGEQSEEDFEDYEDEGDFESYSGFSSFDREEIEVAIDEFVSRLISEGILKKGKAGKPPSFSGVMEKFFGKDHELTEKAKHFEEFIEGYFGAIDYDDMRAAYGEFQEIRETINAEIEKKSNA